ncbi:TetR family transcriptional regulator [Alkalicoccobacillus gibsonii]|uniref:TetR family transcriptional regulator n=1 Tax=Alkalicoccobacillus gibsonii TaxID=79881 RepID=UPI003F7C9ED2
MDFFKILYQVNSRNLPFYKQVYLKDCIVGKTGYSYAIPYNPQSFNNWLLDEQTFKIVVKSTVKQLLMSNYKFQEIITNQDDFNLRLVDHKFKSIGIGQILDDLPYSESIVDILEDQNYQMSQLYFRTKNQYMLTVKSNGVLGVDDELSEEEVNDLRGLIDFISFGTGNTYEE